MTETDCKTTYRGLPIETLTREELLRIIEEIGKREYAEREERLMRQPIYPSSRASRTPDGNGR